MTSTKFYEFWLCGSEFVGLMYKTSKPTENDEVHYHVIEYAALEAANQRIAELEDILAKHQDQYQKIIQQILEKVGAE